MKSVLVIALLTAAAGAQETLTRSPFHDRPWFIEAITTELREDARDLDQERTQLESQGLAKRAAELSRDAAVLRNTARMCELEGLAFLRRCILAADEESELERLSEEIQRRGPGIATRGAIKSLAKTVVRHWNIVTSVFVDTLAPARIQADPDEILVRWTEFRPADRAWAVRTLLQSDWANDRDLRLVARELERRQTSE